MPLCGIPLIGYTIRASIACAHIERTFVSTEDPEIAKTAMGFDAQVITRPAALASDSASTVDVVLHALAYLKRDFPVTGIVILQPTSPLRNVSDVNCCIELFNSSLASTVVSVSTPKVHPYHMWRNLNGLLHPLFDMEAQSKSGVSLPPIVAENGAVYVVPVSALDSKSLYTEQVLCYEMPPERSVDIDTLLDFRIADWLMSHSNSMVS